MRLRQSRAPGPKLATSRSRGGTGCKASGMRLAKICGLPTLPRVLPRPHILAYAGIAPSLAGPLFHAGAGAALLGRITLGRNAWMGALSVIRADGHFIRVGDEFRLGTRATLHINHEINPCIVGDRVAVGSNACVHACTVGSDVVIGDGVVILDGAVLEDNVVLDPGATVFPNKRVPGGFRYAGSPAKPVGRLEIGEGSRPPPPIFIPASLSLAPRPCAAGSWPPSTPASGTATISTPAAPPSP